MPLIVLQPVLDPSPEERAEGLPEKDTHMASWSESLKGMHVHRLSGFSSEFLEGTEISLLLSEYCC